MGTLLISLLVGLVIGGVVLGILWKQLKTVVKNNAAADYIRKNSFRLTQQQDVYLYKKLDRQPRQQQQGGRR